MSPNSRNDDSTGAASAEPVHPLGRLNGAAEFVFRATAIVGMACLFGAGLVTVVDIIMRFFGSAVFGAVDLVQLLIMATAFTAIPYAFFRDGHVSVDIITQAFPPLVQLVMRAVTALASAALMGLILYYGWNAAKMQMMFGDVSQNIRLPMIWYWLPLLVGSGLSLLACLFAAAEAVVSMRDTGAKS